MSDTISSPQKQALIEAVGRRIAPIVAEHVLRLEDIDRIAREFAGHTLSGIEAAGYRIVRPHDWHAPEGWPLDPLARMTCRRCGKQDGEVALSAECRG